MISTLQPNFSAWAQAGELKKTARSGPGDSDEWSFEQKNMVDCYRILYRILDSGMIYVTLTIQIQQCKVMTQILDPSWNPEGKQVLDCLWPPGCRFASWRKMTWGQWNARISTIFSFVWGTILSWDFLFNHPIQEYTNTNQIICNYHQIPIKYHLSYGRVFPWIPKIRQEVLSSQWYPHGQEPDPRRLPLPGVVRWEICWTTCH